jgi:hypothetical protein
VAGDPAGVAGGEERGDVGDVGRCADAAQGGTGENMARTSGSRTKGARPVSTGPGETVLTVMPRCPATIGRALLRTSMAALVMA